MKYSSHTSVIYLSLPSSQNLYRCRTSGDHLQALGVLVVVQLHVAPPCDVVQRIPQRHHRLHESAGA